MLLGTAALVVVAFFLPWFALLGVIGVSGADLNWMLWVVPAAGAGAGYLAFRDAEDNAPLITALSVLGLVVMFIAFVAYKTDEGGELLSLRFGFILQVLSFLALIVAAQRAK